MGCCLACFKGYERIPENESRRVEYPTGKIDSFGNDAHHNGHQIEMKIQPTAAVQTDLKKPIFAGTMLDQKFSNNHTFEKKFIWVNPETRTLHMSQYGTKDRRHKEASLSDVVGVDIVPPQKYKKKVDTDADVTEDVFLTVRFVRGGGIDLRFTTSQERNDWHAGITEIIGSLRQQ